MNNNLYSPPSEATGRIYTALLVWINLYLYTNTVLDGSVILFVHYRNHFPVANFKTKHSESSWHVSSFKTISGAAFFFYHRPRRRLPKWTPKAPQRRRRRWCSPGGRGKSRQRRVFRKYIYIYMYIYISNLW